MKPAWLIDEQAKSRLMLRCWMASGVAPTKVESRTSYGQNRSPRRELGSEGRHDDAHEGGEGPEIFTMAAMKPVTGVGAPSGTVRRPQAEGHGRDLEGEADHEQGDAGPEDATVQR
jgi:hypothetical protein